MCRKVLCSLCVLLLLAVVAAILSCTREAGDGGGIADDDNDTNDDTDDDGAGDDDVAEGWYVYTVDADEYAGKDSSITVDSNAKVHISYYKSYFDREYHRDMMYATNKTGSWRTFVVDSGTHTSIALDPFGGVHISYAGVKYATNRYGSWQIQTVAGTPELERQSSIAVDSDGKVHICYQLCGEIQWDQCTIGDLIYVTNRNGAWQTSVVDSWQDTGWNCDIALDSAGVAHIVYYNNEEGIYKYAKGAPGAWTIEEVVRLGQLGDNSHSSIALDSAGRVHISYYYNGKLYYATNASGEWEKVLVDQGSYGEDTEIESVGLFNSIALDSEGHVHISYYCDYNDYDPDKYGGELRYATNASGSWEITAIEWSYAEGNISGTGLHTSIAIDSEDYVHISYYDSTTRALKYATNRPPGE